MAWPEEAEQQRGPGPGAEECDVRAQAQRPPGRFVKDGFTTGVVFVRITLLSKCI